MTYLWTSPEINDPNFYHHDLLRQLSLVFKVSPRTDYHSAVKGTHVFMVLARWLFQNHDWFQSLSGPKIIVEHDAYLNFLPESPYFGCWTDLYNKCHFDLIISSGKETTKRLKEQGLPAAWVPKGTESGFLDVPNSGNGNLGYFSCPIAEQETGEEFYFYKSRYEMIKELGRTDLKPISCPYKDFVQTVSGFSGMVTNDETMGEPMAKMFEASSLACAVIRDFQPELYNLGFVEGKTVVSYRTFSEMMEIVDHFSKNPDELIEIGRNARLVTRTHTWRHRAEQILGLVKSYLSAKTYL